MHEHLLCDFTEMMKCSIDPAIRAGIDRIPAPMLALTIGLAMKRLPRFVPLRVWGPMLWV